MQYGHQLQQITECWDPSFSFHFSGLKSAKSPFLKILAPFFFFFFFFQLDPEFLNILNSKFCNSPAVIPVDQSGIPFFGDPGFFPEMKYTNQITMRTIFDTVPSGLKDFSGSIVQVFSRYIIQIGFIFPTIYNLT